MNSRYGWLHQIRLSETDESGRVLISNDSGPILRIPHALAEVVSTAQQLLPEVDAETIAETIRGARARLRPAGFLSDRGTGSGGFGYAGNEPGNGTVGSAFGPAPAVP